VFIVLLYLFAAGKGQTGSFDTQQRDFLRVGVGRNGLWPVNLVVYLTDVVGRFSLVSLFVNCI
jgi:hypothetical protein